MARQPARDLAVVLYDLAWLLPRTIGAQDAKRDPMPPTELEVMKLLVRRPGLSVTEIARELALQPSNVSTAVRALSERGMVERRAHATDARVARLHPTRAAVSNRRAREQAWGEMLDDYLASLPADDRRILRESVPALRSLADTLAE